MRLIIFHTRLSEGGKGWAKERGKCGVWLPPQCQRQPQRLQRWPFSFTLRLVPPLCRDKHSEAEIVSSWLLPCNLLFSAAVSSDSLEGQKEKKKKTVVVVLIVVQSNGWGKERGGELREIWGKESGGLTGCVLFQTRRFQANCALIVPSLPVMTSPWLPVTWWWLCWPHKWCKWFGLDGWLQIFAFLRTLFFFLIESASGVSRRFGSLRLLPKVQPSPSTERWNLMIWFRSEIQPFQQRDQKHSSNKSGSLIHEIYYTGCHSYCSPYEMMRPLRYVRNF